MIVWSRLVRDFYAPSYDRLRDVLESPSGQVFDVRQSIIHAFD